MLLGGFMTTHKPERRWTLKLWVTQVGEVLVAVADSILGNLRR